MPPPGRGCRCRPARAAGDRRARRSSTEGCRGARREQPACRPCSAQRRRHSRLPGRRGGGSGAKRDHHHGRPRTPRSGATGRRRGARAPLVARSALGGPTEVVAARTDLGSATSSPPLALTSSALAEAWSDGSENQAQHLAGRLSLDHSHFFGVFPGLGGWTSGIGVASRWAIVERHDRAFAAGGSATSRNQPSGSRRATSVRSVSDHGALRHRPGDLAASDRQ